MKVRVTMEVAGRQIDETLIGTDADDILAQAKARAARELGWKGLFLNAMTPLSVAQKAVALYNSAHQTTYAPPQTADEFLRLGQDLDYIQILPDSEDTPMTNYDDLPLFPLHVVLFPDMPLPLHIFEPRYREMILRCREKHSPFGITLIQSGGEVGEEAIPHQIGTTARITQYEELSDGRMNILVIGEMRFQILRSLHDKPYLSAQVQPFQEQAEESSALPALFATVADLFRAYLKSLLAMTGRALSALQLPQEPEALSFAIASVLQIPNSEKQSLLEMTDTAQRLTREIELLQTEIEAQESLPAFADAPSPEGSRLILPVDTRELGKLASLN